MAVSPVKTTLPVDIFRFSGQSVLETWSIRDLLDGDDGWRHYETFLGHEPELAFQRIRELADQFPTYQHFAPTGRPPINERTVVIALLLKQFLDTTFARLESYLRMLSSFFRIDAPPDSKTLSRKNRSRRVQRLLERLHNFIMKQLPARKATIATDATGYGHERIAWSRVEFGLRATQNWVKVHAAVELPSMLYLNEHLTPGRTHESVVFDRVWENLPENVDPTLSLADAAYGGNACLETAEEYGATAIHALHANAAGHRTPNNSYGQLVRYANENHDEYTKLLAKRAAAEAAFATTKTKFGSILRCRHPLARANEIKSKHILHNVRMLLLRDYLAATRV